MPALPLLRGTAGHKAVDFWLRYPEKAEALLETIRAQDTELAGGLKEYFAKYKGDTSLQYVKFGFPFAIPIQRRTSWKRDVVVVGDLDGLVEDSMGLWVVERKFTSRMPSDFVARFQLDDQVLTYDWAAHRLGYPTQGAIVEITRCSKYPETVRDRVIIDDDMRSRFTRDLYDTIEEIQQALDNDRFPTSPHSCFNFGECPYRMLCLNPDRAEFAESMGYEVKVKAHEEEVLERATDGSK